MKTSAIAFSFAVFLAASLYSCVSRNVEEITPPGGVCDSSYIFSGGIADILEIKCSIASCHDAGFVVGDFTIYEGVKEKFDDGSLESNIFTFGLMPPKSSGLVLTDCEKGKIRKWMDDGAPK